MATITINVKAAEISANLDSFIFVDKVTPDQELDVLANDSLGVIPTRISNLNDTDFNLGTVVINPTYDKLLFTPNGIIGTSYVFYTIIDSTNTESETRVTITTIL